MKLLLLPVLLVLFCTNAIGAESPVEIQSRIKRQPVVSSNVASIGYSLRLHVLEIEFTRGAVYLFFNVQPRVYRELTLAPSKGRFIAANIRGKYRFVRVRSNRSADNRLPTSPTQIPPDAPGP